jgi:hypothetical protein
MLAFGVTAISFLDIDVAAAIVTLRDRIAAKGR